MLSDRIWNGERKPLWIGHAPGQSLSVERLLVIAMRGADLF